MTTSHRRRRLKTIASTSRYRAQQNDSELWRRHASVGDPQSAQPSHRAIHGVQRNSGNQYRNLRQGLSEI